MAVWAGVHDFGGGSADGESEAGAGREGRALCATEGGAGEFGGRSSELSVWLLGLVLNEGVCVVGMWT